MTVAEIYKTMEYGPAPEAPQLAQAWLEAHGRKFGAFIGGEWVQKDGAETLETLCPGNAERLGEVIQCDDAMVDAAVAAARAALGPWQALSGHERAKYLYAIARQIQKHSRLFSVIESLDNGKPIRETRDLDIPLVARHFYHHAGWAQILDSAVPGYEAVGVCGQVIPWNFPLLMLSWKIAPALAAGNTVVLKPAEFTPLSALLFAEICENVGLPKGVVNIVPGDGRTGKALVEHPGVDKVAFTGSTEVGRIIRKAIAGSGKKLSLELGGKSPFIVFDDADIDGAIEGIVDAIWFNQGQVCCAGSRLLVHEGIAEGFLERLRRRMETLRVGDPLDKAVDIGAIIAPVQLERIQELVEQGVAEGAEIFQPSWACPKDGWFYPPTLLTNVGPASTVVQVEIFGPVLVAMTFRTPSEAVALANNSVYGLAASVWSENVNLALDIAAKLQAGTVWVNCTNHFDGASGFGGFKESGYGREGGIEGLYEYLKPKAASAEPAIQSEAPKIEANGLRVDRTPKQYIGGKQARPDSGYSYEVFAADGSPLAEIPLGNRKDIRNAVEAARTAQPAWANTTAHLRAQVLYYIGENLDARRRDFTDLLMVSTGISHAEAEREVDLSVSRLFTFAAWADKFEGRVHRTAFKGLTYTLMDAVGSVGIVCPDARPLLSLVTLSFAPIAMGNAVVVAPSEKHPLLATELYQVLDTSDLPGGVWNLVCGKQAELEKTLAEHDGLEAIWHFGTAEGGKLAEVASIGNLKQTWTGLGKPRNWAEPTSGELNELLRRSVQVKNVWVPTGE